MLALLSLLVVAAFGRVSHEGEYIVRCRYQEGSQIHALENGLVDVQGVLADNIVDVRVQRPEDKVLIEKYLTDCSVIVEDLEKLTREVEAKNEAERLKDDPVWFSAYHTYDELKKWYSDLAGKFPTLVKFYNNIDPQNRTTNQNRTVFGVSVYNYNQSAAPRYRAWHTAGIHAREWIAPATLNYILDQLVSRYNDRSDQNVTNWVNAVETFFVGSLNPDGYVYSWNTNRQWRKNRRPPTSGTCFGVDNNRNFPDHWGQGGSSSDPCSDTYMGPSAGSEPETNAVTARFRAENTASSRIILAIDWHSYSQLFLRPYGWTNNVSVDESRFVTLGNTYVSTINATSRVVYTSQRSYQLYQTTGSASDWYYGASNPFNNNNRTAGWTVELRPSSNTNNGFVLDPSQITPTGNENWQALKTLMVSLLATPLP